MVVPGGGPDWNEALSSSCQSLTIFSRFGPEPTYLEASDTTGRRLTTLFIALIEPLTLIM